MKAGLMSSSDHNVPQNIAVFGFYAEPFKTTPIPCRVQVRRDSGRAAQEGPAPICLKPILGTLEP